MKTLKIITSLVLSLTIIFSGISVMAVEVDNSVSVGSSSATFDTSKQYYIWLKQDSGSASDPLSALRSNTSYRWNINGGGNGINAEVHLDYQSGDNCEMRLKDAGSGYYGIRYEDSSRWIDTEKDDGKIGRVLHQNDTDLQSEKYNQHFKFIPVDGEADTYYITCRKGAVYVGLENNKTEQYSKIVTTSQSDAQKWIVKAIDDPILTGQEEELIGSQNGVYNPTDGAPVFTLNPEGYTCDVNVHNDSVAIGDRLQLYYIGTSSKISAEWIKSKKAYRLRSYSTQEDTNGGSDYVWDVDDESLSEGATAHIWTNKGNEHASQLWRFIPVEGKSGVYYIYNVNSSLYLSIDGGYDKSKNDENDVKLVQSKTAFPWELYMLNKNEAYAYDNTSNEKINSGNWMSKLPDSKYLSEINMPGTHDAGAARMLTDVQQASATMCQQLYLDEQLNAGVRAWDIRIDRASAKTESDPNIVHGMSAFCCRNRNGNILELNEVMTTAKSFLESHPKETIVITLKGDGNLVGDDEDVADHILSYIKELSYPIYRPTSSESGKIPTLGEVRGKIVFIRRLSLSDSYINALNEQSKELSYSILASFGPDASKWDDNDYSEYKHALQVGDSNVYVQDNYNEGDADKKYEYFKNTITDATSNKLTANGKNYLFNYSAAKDNLSQPREINKKLMSETLLDQQDSYDNMKTIGMVMSNYIDAKLSKRIYMTNFATKEHMFDDNGFCTICGAYQPATLNSSGVYEISNAGQLFWFASLVNGDHTYAEFEEKDQTAKAVLTKDIDLENREWMPIMNFNGEFDGHNYTISNLKITKTTDCSGLFGASAGTIKNFSVKGEITLSSGGSHIGGVLGYADGATVTNVSSYINISNSDGELKHIGGVIGSIQNNETFVDKCVYYGNIDVKNSLDCIGGVIAYTNGGGRINNCANHGSVTVSTQGAYAGGILGYVNNSNPTVKNCYNYGMVSNGDSTNRCGAIVGWARNYGSGNITNNYYLEGSSSLAFGSESKFGASATAKTSEKFKSGEVAYLLNNSVTDGTQAWYQNIDNGETPDDYPKFDGGTVYYLSYKDTYSNTYSEKPDEPDAFDKDDDGNLIIKTYDDLVKLSQLIRSDYDVYGSQNYILTNNIKADDSTEWTQGIGSVADNKPFNGNLDGNGYCIIGLNVNAPEYGGLFEIIGESGCVKNLFVFDCDYMASSKTAGGIAAINNGTIDHCISGVNLTTGVIHLPNITIDAAQLNSIIKGDVSGGIVGENNGLITGCRNASVVSGTQCGGIASINMGKIYGCANNAKIGTSNSSVSGGLVGKNSGTIESSYNSGVVNAESEKSKGSIVGINGYNEVIPTVTNVFYLSENGLNVVGTDSAKTPDETNIGMSKSSDLQDSSFVDKLNAVSDDSVVWINNSYLNKGYPTIEGDFLKIIVKSAGNNITVKGKMHGDLNIKYNAYGENDNEYSLLSSSIGEDKILKAYSVSMTDNNGNYIPAELWCQGEFEISVPIDNSNVQFAGMNPQGEITYYEPDSVENGIAVFTVSHPMSFAIVETAAKNVSSDTNTSVIKTTNDGMPIQTGSAMCLGTILLVAVLSIVLIFSMRRRNRVE